MPFQGFYLYLRGLNLGKLFAPACQLTKLPAATMFSTLKNTPRYLTMGIDEGTPSQLAPSMGTIAAGSMVSAASSKGNNSPTISANGNSPTRSQDQNSPNQATPEGSSNHSTNEVQIASPAKSTSEPAVDFAPHPSVPGNLRWTQIRFGSNSWFVQVFGKQSWYAGLDGATKKHDRCTQHYID